MSISCREGTPASSSDATPEGLRPSPIPDDCSDGSLHQNLDALRATAAPLAERLKSADPPSELRQIEARDGTATLCWTGAAGGRTWLGRTTMPRVRAEGLLDRFNAGGCNVALVGVGQGFAARLLLERLDPAQALVIVEPSESSLAMVLQVHDFSAALQSGRLLLFGGDDAWIQLRSFLEGNPGYLAPERLLNWPWFTPADVSDATARLADIGAAVHRRRAERIAELRCAAPDCESPRLILATLEPQASALQLTRQLSAAAADLGWSCRTAMPDHPSRRHVIHAAETMHAVTPASVVLVNTTRELLPIALPSAARVAVWLTEDAAPSPEFFASIATADRLIVPTTALVRAAADAGIPADRIQRVPPAADKHADLESTPAAMRFDAEAAGIRMATHQTLWKRLIEIATQRVAAWSAQDADGLLAQAERDTRIGLNETEVRDELLQRVRRTLGPGVERDAYLKVWGEAGPVSENVDGADPVLCLPPEGCLERRMLDAAVRGRPLLIRAHPAQNDADGWSRILDPDAHVTLFATPAELQSRLRAWHGDPAPFLARADAARRHVEANHLWS
ncbi:MAG: glycosyltransferase, partial [Phycisphaerae bacterium]